MDSVVAYCITFTWRTQLTQKLSQIIELDEQYICIIKFDIWFLG